MTVIRPAAPNVDIVPTDPPGAALRAMLGDGVPTLTPPAFGWQFVARPRAWAGTEWTGREGYTLTVPIVFDAFRKDGDVSASVRRLFEMGASRVGTRLEPPVVRVTYPGAAFPQFRYVLQDATPTMTKLRADGIPSYAAFDLTFLQYSALDVVAVKKKTAAAKAKDKGKGKTTAKVRSHVVRKGETLVTIAAKYKIAKWQTIATLNKIRDPRSLKVGQTLRLP